MALDMKDQSSLYQIKHGNKLYLPVLKVSYPSVGKCYNHSLYFISISSTNYKNSVYSIVVLVWDLKVGTMFSPIFFYPSDEVVWNCTD